MRPGVGERQRPHAALEQCDPQLPLERLDLMADGRRGEEHLFRSRLEALELRGDLKGLQKFERRQSHA